MTHGQARELELLNTFTARLLRQERDNSSMTLQLPKLRFGISNILLAVAVIAVFINPIATAYQEDSITYVILLCVAVPSSIGSLLYSWHGLMAGAVAGVIIIMLWALTLQVMFKAGWISI
jgi:hypothetical protein